MRLDAALIFAMIAAIIYFLMFRCRLFFAIRPRLLITVAAP